MKDLILIMGIILIFAVRYLIMDTSHSPNLEIHGDTVLSQVKPERKIFTTFCIVFSIAF